MAAEQFHKQQAASADSGPRRALESGIAPAADAGLAGRAGAKRQPNLERVQVNRMPLRALPNASTSRRLMNPVLTASPPTAPEPGCAADEVRRQAQARVDMAATQPEREAALLDLAGAYVGLGDWASARDIYEHLLAVSGAEPVRQAAERNLEVTRRQVAILAETDPNRRDEFTHELAELHLALGHQQAGERLLKALAHDAQDETLRREATARLRQFGKSAGPPRLSPGKDRPPEPAEAK